MKHPLSSLVVVAGFLLSCVARGDATPTKAECADAHAESQSLRKSGKLGAAQGKLRVCRDDACPKVLREQCVGWFGEVERDMPTVVFVAKTSAGAELDQVKVSMDGVGLASKLDGRAIGVDPGPHVFTFETAGAAAVTANVTMHAGEKNRRVEVTFETAPVVKDTSARPSQSASASPMESPSSRPAAVTQASATASSNRRTYGYVAGGVGVVGLLAAGVFALEWSSKKGMCPGGSDGRPHCPPGTDESSYEQYAKWETATFVGLGVGVVGLAAGAFLLLGGDDSSTASIGVPRVELWTAGGGGGLQTRGVW